MIPRIAFFDLDGTLLAFDKPDISPKVKLALRQLQQHGCLVYLATGRAPFMIPKFSDVFFDGRLCFNGGLCYCGEKVIFANPIDTVDMRTVIANGVNMGIPIMAAAPEKIMSNFYNHDLDDYTKIAGLSPNVADAKTYDNFLQKSVYQLMVPIRAEQDERLLQGTTRVKIARWWERAADVIPLECGKAHGIQQIIAHLGISRQDTLAFGDGGNDADMLQFAGLGIAMGNAGEDTKAAADYVAASCADDGVYSALKHFSFI